MTRTGALLVAAVAVFLATSPVVVVAQARAASAGPQALPKLTAKLPRGEALEEQNRLNRELFTRLARGSNATPGVWMSATRPEAALVVSTSLEGDVFQNLVTGLTAEGLQHAPSEFRFDDRTGTVARYADGHPRQWMRVAMTGDGFYGVITLPTSLLDQGEAQNYRVYYKFSDDILIRVQNSKHTLHRWMPLEEAKKQLAAAERDRALAVQQAASGSSGAGALEQQTMWRSRWGRLADLAGTTNFLYNPVTAEISPVTTNYEWAVPGWKMIISWIQPGQPKQKMAEYNWDPIARRIHIATEVPGLRAEGSAAVDADGSVHIDMGGSQTQWRAGPGGSSEIAVTFASPALTGYTTYAFQDQPRNREITAAMASERRRQIAIEARALAEQQQQERADKAQRSANRAHMLNSVLQGAAQGLEEVHTGGYAEAQQNLDATVASIQHAAAAERQHQNSSQQASQHSDHASQSQQIALATSSSTSTSPDPQYIASPDIARPRPGAAAQRESAAAATGKPLRFVMSISLRNQPGDKVNPTCYSNIVSRPGPPGWGGSGFLPPGSAEQARETVYGLKSTFIAQCRASGREITSDGNFNFQMNQLRGDEERLQEMRARYSEDVSVSL